MSLSWFMQEMVSSSSSVYCFFVQPTIGRLGEMAHIAIE
jgi:hypothetical protein